MQKLLSLGLTVFFSLSVFSGEANNTWIKKDILFADKQYGLMVDNISKVQPLALPKTYNYSKQQVVYIPTDDWCSGFPAGCMWYLYNLTNKTSWKNHAEQYTLILDSIKYLTWHHDVGFMIGSSYLNGYRLGGHKEYKDVIVQTAKSLCTRFRPKAGVIQSWNTDRGWQSQRGWKCPVIIDNMMNLELLFEATKLSGDSTFWNIAVSHANTTLKNHFRKNASCYHVVDYDDATGKVRRRVTAQGYADESAWARGQAWAIYGFTVCYRYTKDSRYLDLAERTLNFVLHDKHMPKDLIPYWDYNAPEIPNEPRDVSAAACIASALYEMEQYAPNKGYAKIADKMMKSLSTPAYRSAIGANGCFLLMHSVGSIPHNNEIDVPLNYADYYFLEALSRKVEATSNNMKH